MRFPYLSVEHGDWVPVRSALAIVASHLAPDVFWHFVNNAHILRAILQGQPDVQIDTAVGRHGVNPKREMLFVRAHEHRVSRLKTLS